MKALGRVLLLVTAGQLSAAGQSPAPPVDGEIPFHLGRMYARTRRADAWEAMERVFARLSLKLDARKPNDGVLVTEWSEQSGTRFQYHVFIPIKIEPARVYVGSISSRGGLTQFNDVGGNNVLFKELDTELRVPGESIPRHPQRRAIKSLTLVPPDAAVDCLRRRAAGEPVEKFEKPNQVSAAPRAQLGPGFNGGRTGVVVLDGLLGEDGYYQPIRVVEGDSANQDLAFITFGQASLARFRPGTAGGCGVPLTMKFSTTRWR